MLRGSWIAGGGDGGAEWVDSLSSQVTKAALVELDFDQGIVLHGAHTMFVLMVHVLNGLAVSQANISRSDGA